jgi:hypothetical protein
MESFDVKLSVLPQNEKKMLIFPSQAVMNPHTSDFSGTAVVSNDNDRFLWLYVPMQPCALKA